MTEIDYSFKFMIRTIKGVKKYTIDMRNIVKIFVKPSKISELPQYFYNEEFENSFDFNIHMKNGKIYERVYKGAIDEMIEKIIELNGKVKYFKSDDVVYELYNIIKLKEKYFIGEIGVFMGEGDTVYDDITVVDREKKKNKKNVIPRPKQSEWIKSKKIWETRKISKVQIKTNAVREEYRDITRKFIEIFNNMFKEHNVMIIVDNLLDHPQGRFETETFDIAYNYVSNIDRRTTREMTLYIHAYNIEKPEDSIFFKMNKECEIEFMPVKKILPKKPKDLNMRSYLITTIEMRKFNKIASYNMNNSSIPRQFKGRDVELKNKTIEYWKKINYNNTIQSKNQ